MAGGRPLNGKDEIMEYSGLRRKALKEAIELAEFPYFMAGGKMCSHTAAIDDWFLRMSVEARGADIGGAEDGGGGAEDAKEA